MKYVFFILVFFSLQVCSAQYARITKDSLAIQQIWEWSQTANVESAHYFKRTYTYPLQVSQSYIYKGYLIYHFPDRCAYNVVVVDSVSLEVVDMCVGECEWMRKLDIEELVEKE